jgi:hypothetical protein
VAAALYWVLTTVFQFFQGKLERKLSAGYVRSAIKATSQPGVEIREPSVDIPEGEPA